jgi:signal transduction histidine kinase
MISTSVLPESPSVEQSVLLQTTAIVIIIVIAIDAAIIGFFVSRSISKPIEELYEATKEVEKGNFNVKTEIKTKDEIEELGVAFNKTTAKLNKMDEERKQLDTAKSEFLSITSHELRSPMTPMKAQLQMLENEYFGKLTKNQKESLAVIIRNADRLDKIILDFLEISRIESARLKFNFKETDLKETIKETVEFMKGFAKEKKIKIVENVESLPIIEVDPDRVSQVLRNLINNAIKFSKNNSKIEVNAIAEKDNILLSVKDSGCGLDPEKQMRVFEPFYQVEKTSCRKYGGTGLGLTICRGIIESQKGKIWVESKPSEGCTFYFTIPLKPVREIEPIKVLFSQKDALERKIKEEFKTMLGPLGIGEFNELKSKNALWKDDIFDYIDSLNEKHIITDEQCNGFKNRISNVFGEKKEIINDKDDTLESGFRREVVKRD